MSNFNCKLIAALKENTSIERIERCKEVIAENINNCIEAENFFDIPTKEIIEIIKMSEIEEKELLLKVITKMNENKEDDAVLLLNIISLENPTLDDCINIISLFKNSPILTQISELFKEEFNKIDIDYEYEIKISQNQIKILENQIESLQNQIEILKNPDDLQSDIWKASQEGKLASVQYLVEQCKVDATEKDTFGITPLSYASFMGQLRIVKYLFEHCHADVETKSNNGVSPINAASKNGQLEVVKYLYETCKANVETQDEYGRTPINNASINGHLEVVRYLHEKCKANVETKDNWERAPISNSTYCGNLDIIKYLYECCNANDETKDINGDTLLNIAIKKGYRKIVKYLEEKCKSLVTLEVLQKLYSPAPKKTTLPGSVWF